MASLNKVQIIGHIGADPVLNHTTTNQVPVVNLRVATNEGWTDQNGQKHENTTWHTVVCFKKLAQTVAQYMAKGRQIYVEGRLQVRPYMGQAKDANGQPVMMTNGQVLMVQKYATEIVAFNIQFLGKNPNASAYPQANVAVNPAVVAPAAVAPVAGAPVNPANTFVTAAPGAPVAPAEGVVAPVDMTPPAGV